MLGTFTLGSEPLAELGGTIGVNVTQAGVMAVTAGNTLRVTQTGIMAAINFPTEQIRTTQAGIMTAVTSSNTLRVTQARVLVAVRGRISNTRLNAWTFTLDGHDFYVLRLGQSASLVYDTYSEQWYEWDDGDQPFWKAQVGQNWVGGQESALEYGSNIVVGDDSRGILWVLDPELGYDEDPDTGATDPRPFNRVVTAQVPVQGHTVVPCYNIFIESDIGEPAITGQTVTLYTSDDVGRTYDDQGAITVTTGDYSTELYWTSLGQIERPGRLFKIEDNGAITRIDALEMNSE